MIKGFASKETELLFNRERPRKIPLSIHKSALRKLLMLDASMEVRDLLIPPGNKLEKLKGSRAGQYSIRINDQFRVCFRWLSGDAYEVEIVDYH